MNYDEAYLFLFSLLDRVYFLDEKRYDWLGSILSEMNPFLFADGNSADPAVKDEIREGLTKYLGRTENFAREDVISFVKSFLTEYEQKWAFDLSNLLSDIGDNIYIFFQKCGIDYNALHLLTPEDGRGILKKP